MPLDPTKISSDTLIAIAQRLGYDEITDVALDHIESLSPTQAFDTYCEWHGLLGWGPRLRKVMSNLEEEASQ